MSFLSPLFALLAFLAVPILLLYMLKLRRQDHKISSILLWQMVLQDRQANRPWQRLRRNLLLIVQLVILLGLVSALMQPAVPSTVISSQQVIVLLDASASMQAVDISPSRFAAAKQEVSAIVDNLPNGSELTLILTDASPKTLVAHSANKADIRQALDTAVVSSGEANWEAAFALANAAITDPDHTVALISDGVFPAENIAIYTGNFKFIQIGASRENIGINAFSISPTQTGSEIFISIRNYGSAGQSLILSIYENDKLLQADSIQIPANSSSTQVLSNLSGRPSAYRAQISADINAGKLDDFSLDDQAFIAYTLAEHNRILLVSEGNFFLEQFLSVLPDTEAFGIIPNQTEEDFTFPTQGYSVYIYDGFFPANLPNGNVLFINPPENPIFNVSSISQPVSAIEVLEHPLSEFIDLSQVHIQNAKSIQLPEWGETLAAGHAGPLIFVGEYQARRIAVVSFDLLDSDLPLQIAFPILFSNLIDYLNPPVMYDKPEGYHVGETVLLKPGPTVEELAIQLPSGEVVELGIDQYGAAFSGTLQSGIYTIKTTPGEVTEKFAVNTFSTVESSIAPVDQLSINTQNPANFSQSNGKIGLKSYWKYPALLTLMILAYEWWIYYQEAVSFDTGKSKSTFWIKDTP